jgi:hypothetical protein
MILRRITPHVKDQNWFAVGLDLIVAVSTYQKVFDAQLSAHEIHQASFTKLREILAKEKSDHG